MNYSSLITYYKTAFALAQHHKWDINSIEDLVPYERDLYVDLLAAHMKEQQEREKSRSSGF